MCYNITYFVKIYLKFHINSNEVQKALKAFTHYAWCDHPLWDARRKIAGKLFADKFIIHRRVSSKMGDRTGGGNNLFPAKVRTAARKPFKKWLIMMERKFENASRIPDDPFLFYHRLLLIMMTIDLKICDRVKVFFSNLALYNQVSTNPVFKISSCRIVVYFFYEDCQNILFSLIGQHLLLGKNNYVNQMDWKKRETVHTILFIINCT